MAIVHFYSFFGTNDLLVLALMGLALRVGMGTATGASIANKCQSIQATDGERIRFGLNMEFLEAEFFLYGALGVGLDSIAPHYALGGPSPIGARKANLEPKLRRIIEEFGYQEVGHIRAIFQTVGGFPRPLMDLRAQNFAHIFNQAIGRTLTPPFDPYANSINFFLAAYIIPYVGAVGYVGSVPNLSSYCTRKLAASILASEAGQDAIIRVILYEEGDKYVHPYRITVAEMTDALSNLRSRLGSCGIKDEGLTVPFKLRAENRTTTNVLSLDANSLWYSRAEPETLRIVYGTGNERVPGGFYPNGASGKIAVSYIR